MLTQFNGNWNRQIIRRILQNQEALQMELPWFWLKSEEEQFRLAMQFGNQKKGFVQMWKILITENLPIIFSIIAILAAISK